MGQYKDLPSPILYTLNFWTTVSCKRINQMSSAEFMNHVNPCLAIRATSGCSILTRHSGNGDRLGSLWLRSMALKNITYDSHRKCTKRQKTKPVPVRGIGIVNITADVGETIGSITRWMSD